VRVEVRKSINIQEVTVAHHKSAIKRIKTSNKARLRNINYRTMMRNHIKKFRGLVTEGNAEGAREFLPTLVSRIQKSVSKGILHSKTGSRYISRLTRSLDKIENV